MRDLRSGVEAITDPGFGQNVLRRGGIRLDLFSELADEDSQVFGLLDVVAAPDGRKQRPVSQHFASVTEQVRKQVELFRCKMNLFAPHRDAASFKVEAKVA